VTAVDVYIAMYKRMISDRKYGLTYSLMASKVLPVLIPHCVNPALNAHQVVYVASHQRMSGLLALLALRAHDGGLPPTSAFSTRKLH